nr:Fic family protein [Pseudomarimonas arenosa]
MPRQALQGLSQFLAERRAEFDSPWWNEFRLALGFPRPGYRNGFHWVGGGEPGRAWLIPPPVSALEGLMGDLSQFLTASRDPLATMALAAYQLIHIHPYSDGNGRCARALILALGAKLGSASIATALGLLFSMQKQRVGNWMLQLREGCLQPYLQQVATVVDLWQAAKREHQPAATESLHQAFNAAHLARWYEALSKCYLQTGALSEAMLVRLMGGSTNLARKYVNSLVSQLGWEQRDLDQLVYPPFEYVRHAVILNMAESLRKPNLACLTVN